MRITRFKVAFAATVLITYNAVPCFAQPGPGDGGAVLRNPFDPPAPHGGTSGSSGLVAPFSGKSVDSVAYKELMASMLSDARYTVNRDIQPTPEVGPWMICIHSYAVKEAPEFARQMCAELRSTYRLPAYVFTHGLEERRKEMERVQAKLDKQRQFYKDQNLEIMYAPRTRDGNAAAVLTDDMPVSYALQMLKDVQHIQMQCAILVGGYASEEAAHTALAPIKKLKQPDPNRVKLDVKFYGEENATNQGKLKFQKGAAEYVNPFARAFVCRNPSIKADKNAEAGDGMDIKVLQKWNSEEPYSLLNCRKPITLAIKQFQTFTTVQGKDEAKRVLDTLGSKTTAGKGVDQAAHDAHQLADLLRKNKKLETYVLHTKYCSVVTVGGYDSLEDPSLVATQNTLAPQLQAWPQMMFFPRPMPMKVPR